jgi:hypothetical protein
MPIPIPPISPQAVPDAPPGERVVQPTRPHRHYYLRDRQNWAVQQERMRHNEALYYVGEWVFFVLMWTEIDFSNGLVARCSRCWTPGGKQERISEAFKQPMQNECPACFGTTFDGGYRARIVRPAMITDVEETEKQDRRGSAHPAGVQVQTTHDFRSRPGDFMFRPDGTRWRLTDAQRLQVHTGYQPVDQASMNVSYTLRAGLEEKGSVAYLLPPDLTTARAVLNQPMQLPGDIDWSRFEEIGAP